MALTQAICPMTVDGIEQTVAITHVGGKRSEYNHVAKQNTRTNPT